MKMGMTLACENIIFPASLRYTVGKNKSIWTESSIPSIPFGFTTVLINCHVQVRIQDLVKGGAPASEAESCRRSGAESRERSELSAAGVQGPLKGPGSF